MVGGDVFVAVVDVVGGAVVVGDAGDVNSLVDDAVKVVVEVTP